MEIGKRMRQAASLLVALAAGVLIGQATHFDHVAGTYGVSIGSQSEYCSVEFGPPHIGASCQGGN